MVIELAIWAAVGLCLALADLYASTGRRSGARGTLVLAIIGALALGAFFRPLTPDGWLAGSHSVLSLAMAALGAIIGIWVARHLAR